MNNVQSQPLWRQLRATIGVVEKVSLGRSASDALPAVDVQLRPAVQALAFQVWRHYGRSRFLAAQLARKTPRPWVHAALCTGLALLADSSAESYDDFTLVDQLVEAVKHRRSEMHQAAFVNACIRRYLRERTTLDTLAKDDLEARWNFPLWWIRRLQKDHPASWERILETSNLAGPMSLRVNQRTRTPNSYLTELEAAGLSGHLQGDSAVVLECAVPVQRLPGFAQGHVSVQDAGAQRAAELLLNGFHHSAATRILDACAAPGGKTGHLLESSEAAVWAVEVDPIRAQRIKDNLQRLNLHAVVQCASLLDTDAWWDGKPFDLVLLDAPCTASGIVRRHPDVRWLRREADITALSQLQSQMLQKMWGLLRPGGRLLYCTCSIFTAEGSEQQMMFLRNNKDAQLLTSPGHLLPRSATRAAVVDHNDRNDHDGFFYALFQKNFS